MDRFWALLKILIIVSFVGILASESGIAYMPPDPASNGNSIDIGRDDGYRRHGMLADMRTCLAVADDDKATALLLHRQIKAAIARPPSERADALRAISTPYKRNPGYGTLLICAEIVSAWSSRNLAMSSHGALSTADPPMLKNDGRFEHSAFVIDLSFGRSQRASIGPVTLARLLSSPGLLPPSAYGGIVVKNAVVKRTLIFHNLRLTRPVAFINVKFSGGTINQAVFNIDDRTAIMALALTSTRLDNHLLIADSQVCGSVDIKESHFQESLTFRNVEQFDIGCAHRPNNTSTIALRIEDSRFDKSLSMLRTRFSATAIAGITADKLTADRVDFGRRLSITESTLGSLQIECSILADRAEIERNKVDQDMLLDGTERWLWGRPGNKKIDSRCSDWWAAGNWDHAGRAASIRVKDNRIGGGLIFQSFAGAKVRSPLVMSSNYVRGRSQIVMPSPTSYTRIWKGDVNLQGSDYESMLEFRRSPWRVSVLAEDKYEGRYCREISREDNPLSGIAIQLRATHIRTLRWDLPLTCDYRWLGYGLTYDLWLQGDYARSSLGVSDIENTVELDYLALEAWRQTLKRYDSPSISAMSRYLDQKGEYVVSRSVLQEAKRLNYTPTCPPDQWMPGCAVTVGTEFVKSFVGALGPPSPSLKNDGAPVQASIGGFDDQIYEGLLTMLGWLWRFVMLILLWPGGYGAEPERAFVLLIIFFGICWYLYKGYTRRMRGQLLDEWSAIDRFFVDNEELIGKTERRAENYRGLEDAQTAFGFEGALPDADDQDWHSKEVWTRKMTHEGRLREVQGPLLARVRAWEDAALDVDLETFQTFREHLERFGNTEIVGFGRFDGNKMPTRFTERVYSFDTMLPVIDLHAYSNYYPIAGWVRTLSVIQHVCGWWWVSVFIASAAIL